MWFACQCRPTRRSVQGDPSSQPGPPARLPFDRAGRHVQRWLDRGPAALVCDGKMTEIPPPSSVRLRAAPRLPIAPFRPGMPPGRSLRDFHLCALAGLLLVLALVLGPLGSAGGVAQALPLAGYAILVAVARVGLARGYPHPRFGACNVVTFLRATGVAGLTAVLALPGAPMGGWLVPGVAAAILSLDGIDGWLARRAGRCSAFGARFDMETDAALALVLAALIWQAGLAGPWVLWLGLARYGFVGAGRIWPWLRAPLPPRWRRKAGCVVQIGALVLALLPGLPAAAVQAALVVAAAMLVWSFGADVAWLRRHGPAPGQARRGTSSASAAGNRAA